MKTMFWTIVWLLTLVWLMPNSWKYRRWVIGGHWVKIRKIEGYEDFADFWRHERMRNFLTQGENQSWRMSSQQEIELEKEYYSHQLY